MALTVLNTYKNRCLLGTAPNLTTANKLKVVLVTSGHTHNGDTQSNLSSITSTNRVMTSNGFTGIVSGRNLDAADGVTLNDTGNSRVSTQAYLYYDTDGTDTNAILIAHDNAVNLTSDGTNDVLNFNASGIFDL